jgi:hypothetical protein
LYQFRLLCLNVYYVLSQLGQCHLSLFAMPELMKRGGGGKQEDEQHLCKVQVICRKKFKL